MQGTNPKPEIRVKSMFREDMDMARRRGQRKGYLFERSGSWIGQWREDVLSAEGALIRKKFAITIAPAEGPGALSKRQAQRTFYESILSKLDSVSVKPQSLMSVTEFIRVKFEPEVVWMCKPSGRKHYEYILGKHVVPIIGERKLRDVTPVDVQKVIRLKMEAKLSTQTVAHVRNAISAVFRHAKLLGYYAGENPAALVRLPEMERKQSRALSLEQVRMLRDLLPLPAKQMALVSIYTSLNVAEMLGLRWKRVNLTAGALVSDGELIPPFSAIIRENYYRGSFCSVKSGSRNRTVPLPQDAVISLLEIRDSSAFKNPEDVVFASKNGTPLDEHNIAARHLKKVGKQIGAPWLSWHVFRRTHTTLAEQIGMPLSDRIAQMGHSNASMTQHYTISDIERRRGWVEKLAAEVSRRSNEKGNIQ